MMHIFRLESKTVRAKGVQPTHFPDGETEPKDGSDLHEVTESQWLSRQGRNTSLGVPCLAQLSASSQELQGEVGGGTDCPPSGNETLPAPCSFQLHNTALLRGPRPPLQLGTHANWNPTPATLPDLLGSLPLPPSQQSLPAGATGRSLPIHILSSSNHPD